MARFVVVIVFSLALILATQFSYAFENGDFQYWNTESAETKLIGKYKVKVEEEFRFGDGLGTFYYNHTDVGIKYPISKSIDLSLNYRQIFERQSDDDWDTEYRPHLNTTFKWKVKDAQIDNRSRLEFRIKESGDNKWRLRHKLTFLLPFKWTEYNIQPYVADEVFVHLYDIAINRNRLYVGFKAKILKNLKGEIYYLTQITKGDSNWTNYNVLGTKLKIAF